ncbi:MAG TPA: hypothetical protein VKQ72_04475 [Aggregatilineales bacterium]|nr:hypothetical protein [Aggregatilineales bacterium]
MRLSPLITALAALLALGVVGAVGQRLLQPNRPLLTEVSVSPTSITPNAGHDDITTIRYTLNRDANVTIAFTNQASGKRFVFRNVQPRPADSFQVQFSGVVEGYTLPGETNIGDVLQRLIPDGTYTWSVDAVADSGETGTVSGTLTVASVDAALPAITDFSISPKIFSPNQDGVDDRVSINVYLAKKSTLTVYLQSKDNQRYYISERDEGRLPGDPGAHVFDYDGGVDNNITPPPNGDYTVIATAEDSVGQRVQRTGTVTITQGGLPNAELKAQTTGGTVAWATAPYKLSYLTNGTTQGDLLARPEGVTSSLATISMPLSDLLIFRVSVSNYGSTPLRTVGPWPGTVYEFDQTAAAMNAEGVSGAWRVGLECERSETTLPWRWAIGSPDQLTKVDHDGQTFWYLPPGQQAVVWGAIHMTQLTKTRNPQECWAALIHEDVAIPPLQSHVGAIQVLLETTTSTIPTNVPATPAP